MNDKKENISSFLRDLVKEQETTSLIELVDVVIPLCFLIDQECPSLEETTFPLR